MANQSKEKNNNVNPFFSHDIGTRQSSEIKKLLIAMGWEGYGLWWAIVEYMHRNPFPIEDETVLAYDLRCDKEKIHQIMNDFGLFEIQEGHYVSNRILRNLNYRNQKSNQTQEAANARWIVATFIKLYEAEFAETPALTPPETKCLKEYARTIDNLKEKLPDILYTLKNLKFKDIPNFKPCANWLLAKNNLARLVNGEFGKLQHKKTEEELQEEKEALAQEEAELNQPTELELQMAEITNKEEALNLLIKECTGKEYMYKKGKLIGIGPLRELMNKFCIKDEEVIEKCVK